MSAAQQPDLCNLALIVQSVLAARHHPNYVAEKVRILDGMRALDVLDWSVVYLDAENQCSLEKALGFDAGTMRFLRQSFDKVRYARLVKKEAQPCSSQ